MADRQSIDATFVFYHIEGSEDGFGVINNQNTDGSYGLVVRIPGKEGLHFVDRSSEGTNPGEFTRRELKITF